GLAADAVLKPGETFRRAMATARGAAGMLEDINAEQIIDPIAAMASGLSRRLDHCSVPMQALRHARKELDATINDLVLTAVSGAVGRYHVHRGHHTEELRAMVPMSLRTNDERSTLGNRVGMLNIKLPIAESDPLRRLELIQGRTGAAKRDRRGALYPFLMRAMVLSPGFVFREFVRQMTTKVNLICTNIPGTPDLRYYSGQPVERIIPYAPIMERCPISVALLSYRDHLEVGIALDPEAIPDHDKFRLHLSDAFAEVLSLAGPPKRK
ncbi:MAG: WS/DGAT domain-containing protein, partial [Deltaproteobacteria bacterium]|nr:WS/DGAT domain-containing protein [Deltaproteobacteria bacterium]